MNKKTIVFIDYANLRASVRDLGLFLDLKSLLELLKKKYGAVEPNFYYGIDVKDNKSKEFLTKVSQFGYKVTTRDVKYIRVNLGEILKRQLTKRVLDQLDQDLKKRLETIVSELQAKNIPVLIPKANMDAEMTMDMVLAKDNFDHFIIFSGDSDFAPLIKYLIKLNKNITVISLRSHTAGEIFRSGCKFIDLRKLEGNFLKKQKPQRGS